MLHDCRSKHVHVGEDYVEILMCQISKTPLPPTLGHELINLLLIS